MSGNAHALTALGDLQGQIVENLGELPDRRCSTLTGDTPLTLEAFTPVGYSGLNHRKQFTQAQRIGGEEQSPPCSSEGHLVSLTGNRSTTARTEADTAQERCPTGHACSATLIGQWRTIQKRWYLFTLLLERGHLTLVAPLRKGNPLWLPCRSSSMIFWESSFRLAGLLT